MGQRRAKTGGEIGANGEWYEGGKFIANSEHAKNTKKFKKPTGKREIDKGVWVEMPVLEGNRIVVALYGSLAGIETRKNDGSFTLNALLTGDYATPDAMDQRENDINAWNTGAKWRIIVIDEKGQRHFEGYM